MRRSMIADSPASTNRADGPNEEIPAIIALKR